MYWLCLSIGCRLVGIFTLCSTQDLVKPVEKPGSPHQTSSGSSLNSQIPRQTKLVWHQGGWEHSSVVVCSPRTHKGDPQPWVGGGRRQGVVATETYLCIQDKRPQMEANRQRKPRWQQATVTTPLDWSTHFSFKKFPGHSLKRPVAGILCTTVHPASWCQYGGNGLAHTFEDPWEAL